jgi:hypothetical protein
MKKLVTTLLAALTLTAATPRLARASNDAEMAERAVTFIEAMASVIDKDNIKGHAAEITELKAWGQTLTHEQKRSLMQKYKARLEAAAMKIVPAMTTCRDNRKVKAAHEELRRAAGG